jgi:hypothetical protein
MLKGKFAVLSLAAAALLCLQVAGVNTVNSGVVDPCNSTASSASGNTFACPASDGDPLSLNGLTISVHIEDNTMTPVVGIPASDFWLIGCNNLLVLCGGSGSIDATAATDLSGNTTIAADIAAGGCDTGVQVVVQSIVLGGGACPVLCLGIVVRSPDILGPAAGPPDLKVDVLDFAAFGGLYPFPGAGHTYGPGACQNSARIDFVAPYGTVDISDFAKFGAHYNHQC